MDRDNSFSLDYTRQLFENILDWYNNADKKAQILLTISGIFLSFLTGTAFTKTDDLKSIISIFGTETWMLLIATIAFLITSIFTALICLRSRLSEPAELTQHLKDILNDNGGNLRQWPETMYFFGEIAQLKDRMRFQARIRELTVEDEINALSSQIFIVSKNVLKKHEWVNRSFLFLSITLIAFLLSGASYVVRVKNAPVLNNFQTTIVEISEIHHVKF